MKQSFRRIMSLLTLLAFAIGLTVSAGAESALETILSTGTAQAFTEDAVPDEDIQKILQAGVSTSSAMNQQPWFFVAITNRDMMKELAASGTGSSGGPEGMGNMPQGMGNAPQGMGNPPEGMNIPEGMNMPQGMNPPSGGAQEGMPSMPAGGPGGSRASLGDSPLAVVVYASASSKSSSQIFDCGLATQNMAIAASSLGYGVKIVTSSAMSLNGDSHDEICAKLGVDTGMKAVAVLLIGKTAESADATTGASVREALDSKSAIIH